MAEWQLFEPGTVPDYTTPAWYDGRPRAPHLEEGAHQARLLAAAAFVGQAQRDRDVRIVDLGAGDGGLLSLLAPLGLPMWGYDLQQSNIDGARERGVDVRLGDVVTGDIEWGDIAIATEMLEHLVDPHAFVRRVAEHSRTLVASSPWTETDQSAYEFHTFAWDEAGYRVLLEQAGFEIVRHERADMFQVIMGVRT